MTVLGKLPVPYPRRQDRQTMVEPEEHGLTVLHCCPANMEVTALFCYSHGSSVFLAYLKVLPQHVQT